MSHLLITGGLGLIGSEIAERSLEEGHHVTIVDDGRASVVSTVEGARLFTRPIEGHWDPDAAIDTVIHCAAPVGPVGILGTSVLKEAFSATEAAVALARYHGARFALFSSSEVYGTPTPDGRLGTLDEWSPRAEYVVGKVASEHLAMRHHHETGLPTTVVRPWNVTGPRQPASKGFVIARMAEQTRAGEPVTVYQPGDQERAFMAVADMARWVMALLARSDDDPLWKARPVDAATPGNRISMTDLAARFITHPLAVSDRIVVVDPQEEHGPLFREAAAGSKLPPPEPFMRGTSTLEDIIDLAMLAAAARAVV